MSIPAEHLARLQSDQPGPEQLSIPEVEAVAPEITQTDVDLAAATARADALQEALRTRPEPAHQPPPPPPPAPVWEEMTTKDIVQMVIHEVRKGDQQTRQELGYELVKIKLEQQINQAQEQFPDFMEYSEDVVRISQEKGGAVSPVEAYHLAKARRGQSPAAARRSSVPTGTRPGTARAAGPKPPVNMRDAASRAFNEVFGRPAR